LVALAWAVGATLVLGITKRVIEQRIAKYAERTETDLDDLLIDLVRRTKPWFLTALGIWIGLHYLNLANQPYVHACLKLAMAVQGGLWAIGCVDFGIGKMTKGSAGVDPSRKMGANVLGLIGRALVWTGVGLIFLSVVMQEAVTSILTGLGVGGIAVALALQNVLGDMFASITILLDKPFVVGDAIVVGEFNGTVEHIGIKTTRLKSVNGEQIVMGNSDLVHSRIRNYKRLQERRSQFTIGVTYQTPPEKLQRIPGMLKEIIEKTPQVRYDRAHFAKCGDFSLQFEAAYFVQHPDYQTYMDAQQAINFELLRRFEAEKIEFAYPTQVVLQRPAALQLGT
jgi:small-conductance mechanosensitive channel